MAKLPLVLVKELEAIRKSRVVVFCATHGKFMVPDDVAPMYRCLKALGRDSKIDVLLHSEGGLISASHKLAMLIRDFSGGFSALIPSKARSAATLFSLGADEIIMSPLAELSPIDANVGSANRGSGEGIPEKISTEDIKAFRTIAKEWFSVDVKKNGLDVFNILNQRFFPTSLSGFFSADRYLRTISAELLACQLPRLSITRRAKIIDGLISDYPHFHSFSCAKVKDIGLNARLAVEKEELLMEQILQETFSFMSAQGQSREEGFTSGVLYCENCASRYASRFSGGANALPEIHVSHQASTGRWIELK